MSLIDRLLCLGFNLQREVGIITKKPLSKDYEEFIYIDAKIGIVCGEFSLSSADDANDEFDGDYDLLLSVGPVDCRDYSVIKLTTEASLHPCQHGLYIDYNNTRIYLGQDEPFLQETCEVIVALATS